MQITPIEWNLHYAGWIIADGEPNRQVGEDFDWFSLEFLAFHKLQKAPESLKSADPLDNYKYWVVAELVFVSEKACVIDFGLGAIGLAGSVAQECVRGDYVMGKIAIDLPLCTETIPEEISESLRCRWHVNAIHADTTPFISQPYHPKVFFRDESRARLEKVLSTASIKTHGYVLHCTKLA